MTRKAMTLGAFGFVILLLSISNSPAISATNQTKQIQSLQKKIKALETSVKVLRESVDSLESSEGLNADSAKSFSGFQPRKLSFVAYVGRDGKCPPGSTPADEVNGVKVENGFSFKNIQLFGSLGGSQIRLGVCEITLLSK